MPEEFGKTPEPSYIELYRSGKLKRRAGLLRDRLGSCDICPRHCGINRLTGEMGFCRTGRLASVSSFCAHRGEEPAISSARGSGTIFFANCNLRCVYCQNYQISQNYGHQPENEVTPHVLARQMLYLQDELNCHNINLVSPSHVVPQIVESLVEAAHLGLHIPLIYNTSSYDGMASLQALDGIMDVYLADLRYADNTPALKYSQAPDYAVRAREAITEMYRQVGDLVLDSDGSARKGLIVRHLILPNGIAGSKESLTWLAEEVSSTVTVSIMAQYYPAYLASGIPELTRTITRQEYREVVEMVDTLGLENGWIQELASADNYKPDFKRRQHPFQPEQ